MAPVALTAEQRRLLEARRVDQSYTPGQWLSILRPLARSDRARGWRRFAFGCVCVLAFMFAFLFGIGFAFSMGWRDPLVVLLLIGIVSLILYRREAPPDLPNDVRRFVLPLISILREEMSPADRLSLRMDLRGRLHKDKQVGKPTASAPNSVGRHYVETHYLDPWLVGKARLADGANLEWRVTDHVRERGRYKKIKYRIKTLIEVRLGLPREDYAPHAGGTADTASDRVAMKSGATRTVVRVRRVLLTRTRGWGARRLGPTALSVDDFVDLVAAAYARVAPGRAGGG